MVSNLKLHLIALISWIPNGQGQIDTGSCNKTSCCLRYPPGCSTRECSIMVVLTPNVTGGKLDVVMGTKEMWIAFGFNKVPRKMDQTLGEMCYKSTPKVELGGFETHGNRFLAYEFEMVDLVINRKEVKDGYLVCRYTRPFSPFSSPYMVDLIKDTYHITAAFGTAQYPSRHGDSRVSTTSSPSKLNFSLPCSADKTTPPPTSPILPSSGPSTSSSPSPSSGPRTSSSPFPSSGPRTSSSPFSSSGPRPSSSPFSSSGPRTSSSPFPSSGPSTSSPPFPSSAPLPTSPSLPSSSASPSSEPSRPSSSPLSFRIVACIHGCLMVVAWVCFASSGIIISRFARPIGGNHSCHGERVWFQTHRAFMIIVLLLTIAGIGIIFIYKQGWSQEAGFHPILGLSATFLAIVQSIMAACRPARDASNRWLFNWTHRIVGMATIPASGSAIILGLNLFEENLLWAMTWFCAFVALFLMTEIGVRIFGCCSTPAQASIESQAADKSIMFRKILISLAMLSFFGLGFTIGLLLVINVAF